MKKTSKIVTLFFNKSSFTKPIFDCERYSSLQKLLRVTAIVFKFIHALKSKIKSHSDGDIAPKDIHEATVYWIKQSQHFLRKDKRFESWELQFGLYNDEDGLLRCRGRLGNTDLPYSTKHPILLNSKDHITELIVRQCHLSVKHGGVKETLTELRSSYWIIRGRNFVRKLLRQCVTCQRFTGKPYSTPMSPPLPELRVKEAAPFSFTGVDFAGPLYIRGNEKAWICLYTCGATRAVHLEMVPGLSAQNFILCFRRFAARRGLPQRMVSDNAKTFKSAKKIIERILGDPTVRRIL